jgi:BirA family biotin operon repressor/biotin-[acetyl-CoA-carboxylase] ligase|tara:strand:+ start:1431 stop:2162 length:732 start_codon:yes stop_codon:yes gene_type:complete
VKRSVIWLDSIDSTNEEMKRRLKHQNSLKNFDAIVANFQTNGKGQREAKWESDYGKNLTFSFYFQPNNLYVMDAFKLNQAVSILISDYLKNLGVKGVQIKWPNDIMVNHKKVCGILIENTLLKNELLHTIIGVGLNVNQSTILSNNNSTSISNEMQELFYIKIVAEELIDYLYKVQDFIDRPVLLNNRYLDLLLGLNEIRKYSIDGKEIFGEIIGINTAGKLRVLIDQKEQLFEQKKLRFLFE